MQKACEVLEALEKISSRLEKEKILESNKDNEELKLLLDIALNPYKTYGVTMFEDDTYNTPNILSVDAVRHAQEALSIRHVTGNQAKEYLQSTILVSNPLVRKWLTRAFKKDLRAGISTKTVNKVLKKLIPEFNIGLCSKLPDIATLDNLKEDWVIEPKLDGLRCIAIYDNGSVYFCSRNNKPLYNLKLIEEELLSLMHTTPFVRSKVVFDGEIYAGNWNDTISTVHAKKVVDAQSLKYYVFDIIAFESWYRKTSAPLYFRRATLEAILGSGDRIKVVPQYSIESIDTARQQHVKNMKDGFEGSVLKRLSSTYSYGRSKDWLKWKEEITVDVFIKGYERGKGRNKDRLGAFICDLDGKELRVGGGYSDEQRDDFWNRRDELVGTVLEIKGQEITKDGVVRFPVFVRERKYKSL